MGYKNFKLTEEIDTFLAENDRRKIISALTSICYLDRNFSTSAFDDGVEYVVEQKRYTQLWEPFQDTPPLFQPRIDGKDPHLCEEDYPKAIAHLKLNFCPERVEDTRRLGQYLFPIKDTPQKSAPTHSSKRSSSNMTQIIAAVAAAAAVCGVILWILRKLLTK